MVRIDPATGSKSIVSSFGMFDLLWDIEIASDGSFLLSDVGNDSLFRVDPTTGDQSILATFTDVRGIAIEPDGDVIVADPGAGEIVRIDPETGSKTLVSAGGFDFAMGVAVTPPIPVPEPSVTHGLLAGVGMLTWLARRGRGRRPAL